MSKPKFSPSQRVRYKPQSAAPIPMRTTTVVGFQDVKENLWEKRYCEVGQSTRQRRVNPGNGKMENRYVIQHYFGWIPSNQKGLNLDLDININRRYQFAFESELSSL